MPDTDPDSDITDRDSTDRDVTDRGSVDGDAAGADAGGAGASRPGRVSKFGRLTGEQRDEARQKVAARFRAHPNIQAIRRELGFSPALIKALLAEAGIDQRRYPRAQCGPRPCKELTGEARRRVLADLAERYQAGASARALAGRYHRDDSTIAALLREAGVSIRPLGRQGPQGQSRLQWAAELRERYEADTALTITQLAMDVGDTLHAVRLLLLAAGATIRRNPPRSEAALARQRGMSSAQFSELGLALRHLYLAKVAGPHTLARFCGHGVRLVLSALRHAGVEVRVTPGDDAPDRRMRPEEALALGALCWPRHHAGASVAEIADPLGPRAIPIVQNALTAYRHGSPEHPATPCAATPCAASASTPPLPAPPQRHDCAPAVPAQPEERTEV